MFTSGALDRLDLRAGQDDAGLERLVDGELVAGSSVEGDGGFVAHGGWPPLDLWWICTKTPTLFGSASGLLTHPQGVRLDGHLLRGGAVLVLSITAHHLLSFDRTVPEGGCPRKRNTAAELGSLPSWPEGRFLAREDVQPAFEVERRPERRPREGDGDVRFDARVVDRTPVRGEPARDREAERAAFAGQLLPLLDGPLAECRLADERGATGVLQRAGDDLARGGAPPIDQAHDADRRVHDPAGHGLGRSLVAQGVLLEEDGPRADELAGDIACGRDVPASVSSEVEDELVAPGLDVYREGVRQLVGRAVGEAVEPHIADRIASVGPGDDLLLFDDVARHSSSAKGSPSPRRTVSVTTEPFGPREFAPAHHRR